MTTTLVTKARVAPCGPKSRCCPVSSTQKSETSLKPTQRPACSGKRLSLQLGDECAEPPQAGAAKTAALATQVRLVQHLRPETEETLRDRL